MAQITRVAVPQDGAAMLELLEAQSTEGGLGIIYTRRPDAYASYLTENPDAKLRICADGTGRITGQGVLLPHRVYIGGREVQAGYITGLRKRPGALVNIPALNREVAKLAGYDLFYCSVIAENNTAIQTFKRPRSYMPTLHELYNYKTYMVNPKALDSLGTGLADVHLQQAKAENATELLHFLRSEGALHDFFPVFAEQNPFGDFAGLGLEDFYILKQDSKILACAALWNQHNYKQYIANGYRGVYRLATAANPLLRTLGYPSLPKVGEAARFAQLAFVLAIDDDLDIYRSFLARIAPYVKQSYDFFVLGVVTANALNSIIDKCRNFNFASSIYLLDYKKTSDYPACLNLGNNPAIQCALL